MNEENNEVLKVDNTRHILVNKCYIFNQDSCKKEAYLDIYSAMIAERETMRRIYLGIKEED